MGLSQFYKTLNRGAHNVKSFLGNAYSQGSKFLSNIDQYAGVARNVIGAVAPIAGSLTGPVGAAVGSAVSAGVQGLGMYDKLKSETMAQANQVGNVLAAGKRGLK